MSQTPARRQSIGAAILAARTQLNLTQADVAQRLTAIGDKVTAQTLSGYEKGTFAPSVDRARNLETVLGCPDAIAPLLALPDVDDLLSRLARIESDNREIKEVQTEILGLIRSLAAGRKPQ